MKKLLLFSLLFMGLATFSQAQTNIPLSKDQEKQVSKINKDISKQIEAVQSNEKLSSAEKKAQLATLKTTRDSQARALLTPEQISTFEASDKINWENENRKIDKIEAAKRKAEMKEKLAEVDKKIDELKKQEKELQGQIDNLRDKQKKIRSQQNEFKNQQKKIKSEYAK